MPTQVPQCMAPSFPSYIVLTSPSLRCSSHHHCHFSLEGPTTRAPLQGAVRAPYSAQPHGPAAPQGTFLPGPPPRAHPVPVLPRLGPERGGAADPAPVCGEGLRQGAPAGSTQGGECGDLAGPHPLQPHLPGEQPLRVWAGDWRAGTASLRPGCLPDRDGHGGSSRPQAGLRKRVLASLRAPCCRTQASG